MKGTVIWIALAAIVVGILVGAHFIYAAGQKNGYTQAEEVYKPKLDSLDKWVKAHPPTIDTVESIIYIHEPGIVHHDTAHIDTFANLFNPDTLIAKKYPYAMWWVTYSDLTHQLSGIFYSGDTFSVKNVGSFGIQGDEHFSVEKSEPWIPKKGVPLILANVVVEATGYPSFTKSVFSSAEVRIAPGLSFFRRLELRIPAGVRYIAPSQWSPVIGGEVRIVLGRT